MQTIQKFTNNIPANTGNIIETVRNMDSAKLARVGAVAVTVGVVALAVFLGKKIHAYSINKQLSRLCANVTVKQDGAQETHFNFFDTQFNLAAMVAAVKAASVNNRSVCLTMNYTTYKYKIVLENKRRGNAISFSFDAEKNEIKAKCNLKFSWPEARVQELTERLNETMKGGDSQ